MSFRQRRGRKGFCLNWAHDCHYHQDTDLASKYNGREEEEEDHQFVGGMTTTKGLWPQQQNQNQDPEQIAFGSGSSSTFVIDRSRSEEEVGLKKPASVLAIESTRRRPITVLEEPLLSNGQPKTLT